MAQPDPALTASIYSDNGLDEVIQGALVPFREALSERGAGERWSLWTMRYPRGGHHLKVRLHGPEEEVPLVRALLAEAVERHLGSLPPVAEGEERPRLSRPRALAVDPEDDREGEHPDRSLLWTTYRRSQVCLGPCARLVEDDAYAARITAALSAAAEVVLEAMGPAAEGKISEPARLRVLLRGLAAGLRGLELFSAEERVAYLEYHRDWLLRFAMPNRDRESAVLGRFEQQVPVMAAAVEQAWEEAGREEEGAMAAWKRALGELAAYVAGFRGQPEFCEDPYSDDAVFPPVFKVFHSFANQLGVDMVNEALVHHLLLRTLSPAPAAEAAVHAGA